jgi:polyisoprenoid-binding protein YceI
MHKLIQTIALAGLTALNVIAAPQSYDFKDPKGVNAVQFNLDSLLEPIAGTAAGITGQVTFDTEAVAATQGTLTIDAKTLRVPNDMMTEHMLGSDWLDTAKNPTITFTFTELEKIKSTGENKWSATAKGNFTLKGVTKSVKIPVTLNYLPGQFGTRLNKPELGGDLLVVRGKFSIKRADYGIKAGEAEDKVAPSIQLTFALVGGAPKA